MIQVLDLRKKPGEKIIKKPIKKPIKRQDFSIPQISWESPSFYFTAHKRYFILVVTTLAVSGGAMLFLHKDILMAIFLLLAALVLTLYSNRQPEISKIMINKSGINIGDRVYYYKDLKSFWIHYNPSEVKELSLESRKWYTPYVKILIEKENPITLRSFLIKFLPEKEQENSLVDIISRKIGL